MADVLRLATAGSWQLISGDIGITLKQLAKCSLKTYETRRIDAVGEVKPNWPDWSFVPDAKADGVDHVIEVLQTALTRAKRQAAEVSENISRVVEDDTIDVFAEQRKSKFERVEE